MKNPVMFVDSCQLSVAKDKKNLLIQLYFHNQNKYFMRNAKKNRDTIWHPFGF